MPVRSARGGWTQNAAPADRPDIYKKYYSPEEGYPDLSKRAEKGQLTAVAAYSRRIVNRSLATDEQVARFFGPSGNTLGKTIDSTSAGGAWWWIGEAPANAKTWREQAAVLDEFNRDGYIVTGKVTADHGPKAAVGTVSEQVSKDIPGQYLPGGGTQGFFFLPPESVKQLNFFGDQAIKTGKTFPRVDTVAGIAFEIRPTNWKDANGIYGYLHLPGPGTVQTMKLGAREQTSKTTETHP
ncbi:hypothetical protein [Caballeronia sp. LjRoot31]|uniref:hypothetical protein n=1 Tax=Caballeronia sp. LjRoot31 TaxID=3342324 RepID=UPI003ECC3A88